MSNPIQQLSQNRRSFIKHAAAAGAVASATCPTELFPNSSTVQANTIAKDVVRLASIGVGGMGGADLASLSSHAKVEVVALCDVDSRNLKAAQERHPKAAVYKDFRKMFAEMHDKIDAVSVSTPDHTHAPAAMTALNHGKHVYCQKPLTHDIYEARQLRLAAAKKPELVTQMGTQIHSHSAYRTAVKLIQSGEIGKIKEAHSWSSKTWGYDGPIPEAGPVPDFLDWDLWVGTAPNLPYAEGHYHPGRWRCWYNFGCGTMGDMAIHILDPVFTALQIGTPSEIISTSPEPPKHSYGLKNQTRFSFAKGTKYTTDDFLLTWSDGGLMPDSSQWPKRFDAEGKEVGLPSQGSMFVGEKGFVLLPHVEQPTLFSGDELKPSTVEAVPGGDHYHLFIDACLGGAPTTAGFDYAGPLTEAVLLGVLANRFPGKKLTWDEASMTISGSEEANALVRRNYRSGFEVAGL